MRVFVEVGRGVGNKFDLELSKRQSPTRRAEAVAAGSGGKGGEALKPAAAVSTSDTSLAAYAQARSKRLEQMGGAGNATS
jgi:hypothetical protein